MNSTRLSKQIANSLFAHNRTRLLVLITTICVIAAGTLTFAAESTGDSYIKYSTSPTRTKSVSLNGSTVSGNIYVHLSDSTINSAMYFLDTNGNYANNVSLTSMKTYPFDLMYRHRDGTARAFDTTKLRDGKHTLVVRTRNTKTSHYTLKTAVFTVSNKVATTPTTKPTTTATRPVTTTTAKPSTTTPVPNSTPGNFVPAFAGDVAPGKVRWGAGIGGNGDPVARHGTELGNRIGLRRTFWNVDKRTSMVSTAKADIAAGRIPWVSVKLNGSWQDNGDGKYDASMLAILNDLSALNGPVWFTVHHEPEGGCRNSCAANGMDDIGGPAQWLRAQENTSKLIKGLRAQGKAKNIAFASILMGWTWEPASGRNPSQWFKAGIWDFAGLDVYGEGEGTKPFLETNGLAQARKFYGDRGLKVAIGEWGIRNQNHKESTAGEIPTSQEQQDALTRFKSGYTGALGSATDGKGAQIIGMAYFDSGLNSPDGTWELSYLQLPQFRDYIKFPTSIQAHQN